MSEVSVTDWQINDIAIYSPKVARVESAFLVGKRYIVQDVLRCECGRVLLDFGIRISQSQTKTQCVCNVEYYSSGKIWVRAYVFKKQSLSDYIRQRLVEEKFKHEG